jgi:hypothetical protein
MLNFKFGNKEVLTIFRWCAPNKGAICTGDIRYTILDYIIVQLKDSQKKKDKKKAKENIKVQRREYMTYRAFQSV